MSLIQDCLTPDEKRYPIEYLGDGVYASFDGYHVWLRTERFGWMHTIALEPCVLDSLKMYAERVHELVNPASEQGDRP